MHIWNGFTAGLACFCKQNLQALALWVNGMVALRASRVWCGKTWVVDSELEAMVRVACWCRQCAMPLMQLCAIIAW
jgi:hypothetical protein